MILSIILIKDTNSIPGHLHGHDMQVMCMRYPDQDSNPTHRFTIEANGAALNIDSNIARL